ncbi:uncharacterized protein N7477_002781 [Penicillium maclennaniae]|uniref:uncharacterized protein n=1 Tax=Penicillium maclennaniae TaxID=1343394 RepID=UPI00253FFEC2|nr:uncharacterized protein N7477_002781 [Penicillium maclennaniae]KAJ5677148.1 hypothetical protein N7477_002781 [Penicillium maclennaniae]
MSDPSAELESRLRSLAIGEKGPVQDILRPNHEDQLCVQDQEGEETCRGFLGGRGGRGLSDPPPTPISPQTSQQWGPAVSAPPSAGSGGPARRPEKQTAVAGRMIAGALGIRAPKRTEEQRAYDRATKEQEIKRRNREREEQAKAKEEEERVKASVWTD